MKNYNFWRITNKVIVLSRVFDLLSLLVFYSLLHSKKGRFFKKPYVIVFLSVLFLIEYFPAKFPFQDDRKIPDVYRELGKKERKVALIYPYGILDGFMEKGDFEREQLSLFRIHHKKIYGGHLSRLSNQQFSIPEENLFLKTLLKLEEGQLVEYDMDLVKNDIEKLRVDYVLIPEAYINSAGHLFIKGAFEKYILTEEHYTGGLIYEIKLSL